MTEPKLLSPEIVENLLDLVGSHGPSCGGLPNTANALRAHIAALEADNAALSEVIQRMRNLLLYPHDEWRQVAAEAIQASNGVVSAGRPGATILEAHAKAIQSAFTEGTRVAGDKMCDRFAAQEAERLEERARWVEEMKAQQAEFRKALVRARNEGLEKAATHLAHSKARARTEEANATSGSLAWVEWRQAARCYSDSADAIRAMMEPEQ
jgi:hypothetical protein